MSREPYFFHHSVLIGLDHFSVIFSTNIHLMLVTSISIITHLVAFINKASGHFVFMYTRKNVVATLVYKKK